jgi:hypothetical protein
MALQVCKCLLALIDESVEIQLRIELAIGGCLLGERDNMPASELLQRVRAREAAYETFHPQWYWETEDSSGTASHQFEVRSALSPSLSPNMTCSTAPGCRWNLGL